MCSHFQNVPRWTCENLRVRRTKRYVELRHRWTAMHDCEASSFGFHERGFCRIPALNIPAGPSIDRYIAIHLQRVREQSLQFCPHQKASLESCISENLRGPAPKIPSSRGIEPIYFCGNGKERPIMQFHELRNIINCRDFNFHLLKPSWVFAILFVFFAEISTETFFFAQNLNHHNRKEGDEYSARLPSP